MQRLRQWLIDSYNGLYKIVLEPYMPRRKTIAFLIAGFLIGLIWAYTLAPVVLIDADPSSLDQSWQDEWVRLIADRYEAVQALSIPSEQFEARIITLLAAVDNPLGIMERLQATDPNFNASPDLLFLAQQAEPGAAPPQQPSLWANLAPFIIGPLVITIVAVILWLLWGLLIYGNFVEPIVKRMRGGTQASDASTLATIASIKAAKQAEADARSTVIDSDLGEPVTRRMSVYLMGRGQYDDSFEIEDKNEMFLGECGSTIAETIGTGQPDKVTAVEVWLFDKDDFVRTMTNVFATEYAYNDPAIRSKLETKGDIVLIKPGAITVLETNTLRLQARVVDMAYGEGPLPPNSYLEKFTMELAVWRKPNVGAAPAAPGTTPAAIPMTPPPAAPTSYAAPPPPVSSPPQVQPYAPPAPPPRDLPGETQPRRPRQEDDPFGGTGDFTPIN